jgi:predicted ABC-type ATPase
VKRCIIIAGPNGAGKTTFADTYLREEGACTNFVNADLIAQGLSPLDPENAAMEAGRVMLARIERFVGRGESFAFESTLSGINYVKRIKNWKSKGYEITIYFLKLPSVETAIDRVEYRVKTGGHHVPEETIRRRFKRGWDNFERHYKCLADVWVVFDNASEKPKILERAQ